MSLINFIRARKTAEKPARINFRNILAVLQSFFRKRAKSSLSSFDMSGLSLPQYKWEQIIWRRTQIITNSPKCWYSGACKVCGCDILGKSMEDRACSIAEHPDLLEKRQPCYPAMMTEEVWNRFKIEQKIKLFE